MNSTIGFVLISIGLFFNFIGCLGLVRIQDLYARIQLSIKCLTFGTLLLFTGAFIIMGFKAQGFKCLLCIAFILLTAPVVMHVFAKAACSKKEYIG